MKRQINPNLKRNLFAVTMIALLMATALIVIRTRPTAALSDAAPFVTSYAIPTPGGEPTNIIALGPNQVWFTMQNAHAIGKLVVNGSGQGTFTKYDTPTANSAPYDLAYDGQYIWFTERAGNKIGRLNPANGAITEYLVPTANSGPMGIAIAPNGQVWFAQNNSNKMARFKPASGTFDEYPYTTAGAKLEDVATASDESIFFTAPGLKAVIKLLPNKAASQRFEIIPVTEGFNQPTWAPGNIAVAGGAPDVPWISAPSKDYVGRFNDGTLGNWLWYRLINQGTGVNGLFLELKGSNFRAWSTQPVGNRAGLLVINKDNNKSINHYEIPLPGANPRPAGITVDANGTAWIAAPGTNAIVAWRAPYFNQGFMPLTVR
ncbi:MAG: hypothetical protein KA586_06005 [Candidatus Promineofilum sp.]|nr:hypothetical protein [Promineifilum sp.]